VIRIGNAVSHISLPEGDAIDPAAIRVNAEVFGLHIFFRASVVEESGEELESLVMFCCVPRSASFEEFQMLHASPDAIHFKRIINLASDRTDRQVKDKTW
jgi:hypothetical protein